MADYEELAPCTVHIDNRVTLGTVEFPSSYFAGRELEPGHDVIVRAGDRRIKVMTHLNDLLKDGEICMTPGLALMLSVYEGSSIDILDKVTFGERVFDEMDHIHDILKDKAHRLKEFIEHDWDRFREETAEEALHLFIKDKGEGPEEYPEVPPNPDDFGVQPEDVYEDPSKDEKIWSPDSDGDGKVRIFRPETDDEDMEGS
jgi:hypothetical protein